MRVMLKQGYSAGQNAEKILAQGFQAQFVHPTKDLHKQQQKQANVN